MGSFTTIISLAESGGILYDEGMYNLTLLFSLRKSASPPVWSQWACEITIISIDSGSMLRFFHIVKEYGTISAGIKKDVLSVCLYETGKSPVRGKVSS